MIQLFIILSVFSPLQEPDTLLTTEEAVAIALEANYSIKLERNNLRIAENNNTLGNAGFLPAVGVGGSASQSIRDTEQTLDFSGNQETRTVDGATSTNYNAGVNLQWTIFDGLRMFATRDRLQELERLNNHAFKAAIQNTISDVLKAFYNTVLEQERLALLESSLLLSQERVNISRDRYEVGRASKLEYLQAQVDFNTDKSALVRQQERITTSKYQLWQLLAQGDFSPDIRLEYEYHINELLSLQEVEQTALAQNPDLMYLRSNREVAMLITKEEERDLLPSLNFNLGYVYDEQQSEVGVMRSNQSLGFNYGLSATMNLFDGFNQRREIQNARIQAESASIALEEARTQLLTSVRSAFLAYQNSLQLVRLEEENLEVANENVEIALERYRIGRASSLEIREAQNNAVNAQIRHLESLNAAKIAEIELMRLSGQIVE